VVAKKALTSLEATWHYGGAAVGLSYSRSTNGLTPVVETQDESNQ